MGVSVSGQPGLAAPVECDDRAMAIQLLARRDVVGVEGPNDGGVGVDLLAESVTVLGYHPESVVEVAELLVAAAVLSGTLNGQNPRPVCRRRPLKPMSAHGDPRYSRTADEAGSLFRSVRANSTTIADR